MIDIEHPRGTDGIITLRVSGRLTAGDYAAAIPELEHALSLLHEPMRMLVRLEDFHGWEIGALWKELKFDMAHLSDPGRIAVVGESALEEWGTRISAPFAAAEMRYFNRDERDAARAWLLEGAPQSEVEASS